jgi:hypothetical protein
MDATFYVYFSHQLYNAHVLYLFVGHTQGSTTVATVGSTLSKHLVTILSVCTQYHKLEHLVYIFSQRWLPLIRIPIGHTQGSTIVATVGSTLSPQLSDYPQRAYPIRLRIN